MADPYPTHGARRGAVDGGPAAARRLLALISLCLCGCLCAAACAPATRPAAPGTAARQLRQVLDRRAAAVLHRDRAAYLASFDPRAKALRATGSTEFADLAAVPLRSWQYEVTDVATTGDTATVRARLRYRLAGYDTAPVSTPRFLQFARRSGRWYVTLDRPGDGGAQQLWQQGPVEAVKGARSLVLGVGQDPARLRAVAAVADRAVPEVSKAWPGSWARRVVVYVPASLDAMAALLGRSAATYRDIAAVTTGETGGAGAAPADRIIVNPDAYGTLSDFGQRVVLTHEITHVATRGATSAATPTWLSEGFADWSAYRGSGRSAATLAPELRAELRAEGPPHALPADRDFAFSTEQSALARAYEEGWLACELVADRWGAERLAAFYREVGAHDGRSGAVADALHDVLSTTPGAFTRLWQTYLKRRLG
ncbi:nuclear transport factor 2 family protein [Streptomyces sp. DW26H14]|uniref:nuclear transport factor 2 family protein n=1 Tax=Streptomyces sp. DW26H14 TaxID=3435395 RepID=UPI00403D909E